jgi:hypothetical protein
MVALLAGAAACDGADEAAPRADLAIVRAGVVATPGDSLYLGSTPYDSAQEPIRFALTLRNLGPATVRLDGPPLLRVENDSDLAFRVSRPRGEELAAGAELEVSVLFSPPRPGRFEATLLLEATETRGDVAIFGLVAEAVAEVVAPELGATFTTPDGTPVTSLDLGDLRTTGRLEAELRVLNTGNTPLPLGAATLVWTGADDIFTAAFRSESELAAGAEAAVDLVAETAACGSFSATLTFLGPQATSLATLRVTASSEPDRLVITSVTTPNASIPAAHSLAIAETEDSLSRVVLGNSAAGAFVGAALFVEANTCAVGGNGPLLEDGAPGTNLWGHRVAVDGSGTLALVTWADRPEARLFRLDADGAAVRLGTFINGGGHGASAALSGDGDVAVVGQRLADSGYNPHGGLWLYERTGTTWAGASEARFRLVPLDPPRVAELGAAAAISEGAELVVGAGLYMTDLTRPDDFEGALFVWRGTRDPVNGRQWGRIVPGQDPDRRAESALLRTLALPVDERVEVGIGAGGDVLAITFRTAPTVIDVHLYERVGDDLWGIPGDPASRRVAHHVAKVTVFDAWGFAMDPSGDRFFVADNAGIVAVRRSGDSWGDGSTIDREWAIPMQGRIAIDRAGHRLVGLQTDDALLLLEVGAPP